MKCFQRDFLMKQDTLEAHLKYSAEKVKETTLCEVDQRQESAQEIREVCLSFSYKSTKYFK